MSKNYWKNRDKLYKLILGVSNKEMALQYQKSAKRIINEMQVLYDKIMSADNPLASHLYLYQDYYEMIGSINEELRRLGVKEEAILDKRLTQMYNANSKLVTNTFGLRGNLDKGAALRAVRSIWAMDGKTFSDRIWTNKALLESQLELGLVDAVATGMPADKLKGFLMERFNVSFSRADCLVRTELSVILNRSAADRYTEAGIEYYEILEPNDDRTCEHCREMNGKKFKLSEMRIGENAPIFHPRCRGAILPVIE